jgi:hypothetical protein
MNKRHNTSESNLISQFSNGRNRLSFSNHRESIKKIGQIKKCGMEDKFSFKPVIHNIPENIYQTDVHNYKTEASR